MLTWALLVMFQGNEEAELYGTFPTEQRCREAAAGVETINAFKSRYPEVACFVMTNTPPCAAGKACIVKPESEQN